MLKTTCKAGGMKEPPKGHTTGLPPQRASNSIPASHAPPPVNGSMASLVVTFVQVSVRVWALLHRVSPSGKPVAKAFLRFNRGFGAYATSEKGQAKNSPVPFVDAVRTEEWPPAD